MQWWTFQLRKFQTPLRITFLSACRLITRHVLPRSMFLSEISSCYHSWAAVSGGLLQYSYLLHMAHSLDIVFSLRTPRHRNFDWILCADECRRGLIQNDHIWSV